MRTEIITYLRSLSLGNFKVSEELPRNESGVPLYLKNQNTIYCDEDQFADEPFISTLGSLSIHNTSTTVNVYVSVDGKSKPFNYDSLINGMRAAKDINSTQGFNSRTCDVSTEFVDDLLLTRLDFTYIRLT
jgi:biopolymer transport protein ExbD